MNRLTESSSRRRKENPSDHFLGNRQIWIKYFHTFARYWHHGFFVIFQAKSSGEFELRYNGKRRVRLAACFRSRSFLESHRTTARSLVVSSGYANMVAPSLVCQARMRQGLWSLSVDVECSEIGFIIQECFGILAIWKINSDNFFILRVKIVKPSVHYGQGHWLWNKVFCCQDRSSVRSIAAYWLNLKNKHYKFSFQK